MQIKLPKQIKDWNKVDPIHLKEAIALWSNVNPHDQEARKAADDEINKTWDLFLKGRENGHLQFPIHSDDESGFILPIDSEFYLTRKELKSFARRINQKPLFLFPKQGVERKYNAPPKKIKKKKNNTLPEPYLPPFSDFADEDLWALSPLTAFLFDEFRQYLHTDIDKIPKPTFLLIYKFWRHMKAAGKSGKFKRTGFRTRNGFAQIDEPLFHSQELLKEIEFRRYPVPKGLIEAREEGDWIKAEKLLKIFHANMKVFVKHGGEEESSESQEEQVAGKKAFAEVLKI